MTDSVCACGCGHETTNHFKPGHDSDVLWALLRYLYGTSDTTYNFLKAQPEPVQAAVKQACRIKQRKRE